MKFLRMNTLKYSSFAVISSSIVESLYYWPILGCFKTLKYITTFLILKCYQVQTNYTGDYLAESSLSVFSLDTSSLFVSDVIYKHFIRIRFPELLKRYSHLRPGMTCSHPEKLRHQIENLMAEHNRHSFYQQNCTFDSSTLAPPHYDRIL